MAIIVNINRCCGCLGFEEPKCVKACPGDLMVVDQTRRKAYIREPRDCWDCMACVKECPTGALETRLPYQIADYKAVLKPEVKKDRIRWTCIDKHGKKEEFDIKRTIETVTTNV